jgi:hypothetical protein
MYVERRNTKQVEVENFEIVDVTYLRTYEWSLV